MSKKKLTNRDIFSIQPQLVAKIHGPEPSLKEIIRDYYLNGLGGGMKKAERMRNRYIKELKRAAQ